MIDIQVNLLKNRLYITYSPYPENTLENQIAAITKAAEKLTPGFTCITRIIDVGTIDEQIMQFIRKGRKLLVERGMAGVVRVGEFSLEQAATAGLIPSEVATYYSKYPCPVFIADTSEKAETILDLYEKDRKKT